MLQGSLKVADRNTDRQTDGQTDKPKIICSNHSIQWHNKTIRKLIPVLLIIMLISNFRGDDDNCHNNNDDDDNKTGRDQRK